MNKELKKILPYFITAEFGLLTFMFLGFSAFSASGFGISFKMNGYDVLGLWETAAMGFGAFTQVLFLLTGLCMLAFGILGIIEVLRNKKFVLKSGKWNLFTFNDFFFFLFAVLSFFELLFMIIVSAQNGLTIGFGPIFNAIIIIAGYVLTKVLIIDKMDKSEIWYPVAALVNMIKVSINTSKNKAKAKKEAQIDETTNNKNITKNDEVVIENKDVGVVEDVSEPEIEIISEEE